MTNSNHSPRRDRLYRDRRNAILMGVCAGIADYFGIAPVIVRIAAVFGLFVFTLPVVIGYFVLGFYLQPKPDGLYRDEDEEAFWRRTRLDPTATVSDIRQRFREIEQRIRAAEAYVTSSRYKLDRDFRDL